MTTVALTLGVELAIYLEDIAPLSAQRAYQGEEYLAAQKALREAASNPPSGLAETSAPATTSGNQQTDEQVETPKRRQARTTRLLGQWRRHEVCLEEVLIDLPLSGEVIASASLLTPVNDALKAHYARPEAMRPFLNDRRNVIDLIALESPEALQSAIDTLLVKKFEPQAMDLELSAFAQPIGDNEYLISVSLANLTSVESFTSQDLSAYDCRISVHTNENIGILPQRFDLAPDDYRYLGKADIIGRGSNCVAVPTPNGGIRSETLPTFAQPVIVPREHPNVPPLAWASLAENPAPILSMVEVAMEDYRLKFETFLQSTQGLPHEIQVRQGYEAFVDELRRFRLGRTLLQDERIPYLLEAFKLANLAFARTNQEKKFKTWRLFQLVYIVSHLASLAAREIPDAPVADELNYADVLWFPAGGGKTEAYLGLIITGLFFDRFRGKQAGVSAWMRFPLRMLSVQQLGRMLRVMVEAEAIRQERGIAPDADAFALGYLVGGQGTPNRLTYSNKSWWQGWETESRRHKRGEFAEEHRADVLVTSCPFCQEKKCVELELDLEAVRLIHRCTRCHRVLPLYISDEEVFRYLPCVVVSTVDKLSGYTWFGEYTSFVHGPRYKCSQHGYYNFPVAGACLVGPDLCRDLGKADPPGAPKIVDAVPALTIQDEMHLLKEELGAFSAHYEGLITELQRGATKGLPSKILAASATIEQFEDQLRQVYGRRPRAFPSQGFELERNFYTETTADTRRVFLGVLPNYRRKYDVAATIQTELLRLIAQVQDDPDRLTTLGLKDALWETPPTDEDVLQLLFNYEVSLGYVNSKSHGSKLDEELRSLSDEFVRDGNGPLMQRVLTGAVPIPDLADAIDRIQEDSLATPRSERLRALVGTSVVSHGVDLDRLNTLVMAGMPTTAADYIQVTARSGRTLVGLIVTVYDSMSRRERSLFTNFESYHRFLDLMVTPVPVNKYALFVANRTVPGIALALFHDLARRDVTAPRQGIRLSKHFQTWWNAHRPEISTQMEQRLPRCFEQMVPGVNDSSMERELRDRALLRWRTREYPALSMPAQRHKTSGLFDFAPLTNFRDIDEPADFSAHWRSREAFERFTGGKEGADDFYGIEED